MTEVGLSPPEEARVQQAADEAFRVLTGNEVPPPRRSVRVSQLLRDATLNAPLHALAVAFLLGVLVARRR
ncbi:MAG TPA: hypothetical protein VFR42_07355 [Candidatus Acidoferrum sp.]|nr:hypothetical protein [Candidatus Acidoferrum sp.]